MLRLLYILLFVFCLGGWAQNYSPVTELSFPALVAVNSSFDISLVTDNSITDADKINLYIISKTNLEINTALVRTREFISPARFSLSSLPGITDKVYFIEVALQKVDQRIQSFLQVLINLNSPSSEIIKLRFYGEFVKDKKVISQIGNKNQLAGDSNGNLAAEIRTYKPTRITRNAARFEANSSLNIDVKSLSGNKLWTGFWLRPSGEETEVLRIFNSATDKVLTTLGISSFQKAYLLNEENEIVNQNAPFFSRKIWSHIGIEIQVSKRIISFYKDGILFGSSPINGSEQLTNLKLIFGGTLTSPFLLEQLRILKAKEDMVKFIDDSKYISPSPATSVILQLNFDSMNEITNLESSGTIKSSGIKLVNSDAPIFSRTPDLDIKVLSKYNYLEWKCPDIKNASHFIVEKSTVNNTFIEIGSVTPVDLANDKLNYIDVTSSVDEVILYRIKQVNKDGSSIYSAQIKVGMGNFEQFKLSQNYPNPFNPITSIEFDLFEDAEIEVIIYNLEGQELAVLQKGLLNKGIHKFQFDASTLPSGVYLYKVSSPVFSQTKKMLLTK